MKIPKNFYFLTIALLISYFNLNAQKELSEAERLLDIAEKWEKSDFDSALFYSIEALNLSRKEGGTETEIKSLNNIGSALSTLSRYPESYAAHQEALEIARSSNDTSQTAKTLNFIGVYYNELSDYDEAQKYFLESYEWRYYLQDSIGIAVVAGNLGLNYYRLKQYDLAEKYMRQTFEIDSINNDSLYLIGDLINIGLVYKHTDRLAKSERVTREALEISRKLDNKVNVALALGNLGMIYVQAKEYSKAEDFLNQSLSLRKVKSEPRYLLRTYANLLNLYQEWGQFEKALTYADSASYFSNIVKNKRQEEKILDNKVKVYQRIGRYKDAMIESEKLAKLRDTMASQSRIRQLASVEGRLNLLEKENEIVIQENDIARLTARNQKIVFGGAGLLLLFAIAYLFRSRSFSKRNAAMQKEFTQHLIKSTEQERKRISSELHDSIGQSLLLIKNKILLNPEEVTKDIGIVDDAISEVRSISQALHPYQFEKLGLVKSLEYLLDQFQANSNIFYSHDIDKEEIKLPASQGIYVYRIVQECINNVEKHSAAKACNLKVEVKNDYFVFVIKDNGLGFNLTENSALLNSLGMKTLKERAQIIGGQLIIDSTEGKGTTIELKVPRT